MLNDINFCSNDLNTGITDSNYDFIPQLNSEDNNISPLFNFSSGFQDSISYIDKDDIISENAYFNKNDTGNNLIPSDKIDQNLKEQKISINERKNNCDNVQIKVINFGRKKKNSIEERNHTKFTFDNILRKIKTLAIRSYLKFINKKINYNYKNPKLLEKINQKNVANAKIDFNRDYLNMTFKDIFSEDVTTKWKTISRKHNKNIIDHLLNEKDEAKREIFVKLLNLRLIDIIKYLRGEKNGYEELNGLEFDLATWNNIKNDEEYFKCFKSNMMEIETILQNKFSRNRKSIKFSLTKYDN
jgi:hypothetical protein